MKYAKLNGFCLQYAPRAISEGHTHCNPPSPEWLAANGYLPVIEPPMPEEVEGFYWESHPEETNNTIVWVWEKCALPPEESSAEDYEDALERLGVCNDEE